jgi:hypothetical protein
VKQDELKEVISQVCATSDTMCISCLPETLVIIAKSMNGTA